MRTYSAKPTDVQRKWFIIDADGIVLGRMAAIVAQILRGKHKTMYTPHIDTGDYVVIVNAEKVKLTGHKAEQRIFYWHSGYPGGIKEHTPRRTLSGRFPERVYPTCGGAHDAQGQPFGACPVEEIEGLRRRGASPRGAEPRGYGSRQPQS